MQLLGRSAENVPPFDMCGEVPVQLCLGATRSVSKRLFVVAGMHAAYILVRRVAISLDYHDALGGVGQGRVSRDTAIAFQLIG
jgi:hypothetical protein